MLGHLSFQAPSLQLSGNADWAGRPVDVRIDAADDATVEDALATAYELWEEPGDWDVRARRVAADQLLATYNEAWRKDGPALDADGFAARLALEAVVAGSDGQFELWYDGGELFDGRSVVVTGSLDDGPQGASIVGS
ncbi:MAG TPA: DUF2262 domain-containing protein [Xanthomonadales bacterium]|nr:DUF2262 domain-containing protein [Xanthomonadales bacterium]